MNIFKYGLIALLAAGLTACPGGTGNTGKPATINTFTGVLIDASGATPGPSVALPFGGGRVKLAWNVTGADTVSIDNSAVTDNKAQGEWNSALLTTAVTYTLIAKKAGAADASQKVTVSLTEGKTIEGFVKRFDGKPAVQVEVQVGNAVDSGTNRFRAKTDSTGKFKIEGVTLPYTISAIPPTTDVPVSFKLVTRLNPIIVLEPKDGIAGQENPVEGFLRVRISNPTGVEKKNIGYAYYIAEGIHEDSLKSNAVLVLKPGEKEGYIRVRFSKNVNPATVSGSIVYLERGPDNYTKFAIRKNVSLTPGQVQPPSGEPFVLTVENASSLKIAGAVTIPTEYQTGVAFPLLKVGKASAILSDARDRKNITVGSQTDNEYGFALPNQLDGVEYRVGVYTESAGGLYNAWIFSDTIPVITTGLRADLKAPGSFQPNSPNGTGNKADPDYLQPAYNWTASANDSASANMYYIAAGNDPAINNCNPYTWTAVGTGANDDELLKFSLPKLPAPARLDNGTDAAPCAYIWSPNNAIKMRDAATSDNLLDGRLVLKRHYVRLTAVPNILDILPVNVTNTDGNPLGASAADFDPGTGEIIVARIKKVHRDEKYQGAGINMPEESFPNDGTTTNSSAIQGLISDTQRDLLNKDFILKSVGPFNNPDEIQFGATTVNNQKFQRK
jgi:hypothetical protein